MERPLLIVATLLRPTGPTGVQTQIGHHLGYLSEHRADLDVVLATPFDVGLVRYPLFGIRYLLAPFSASAALLWYYKGHVVALRRVLARCVRRELSNRVDARICIHARDPWSARVALDLRQQLPKDDRARVSVAMTVHFLHSQAEEWVNNGVIERHHRAYRVLRQMERETLPHVDGLTYVSQMMRDHLEREIPAIAGIRSAVISNGVKLPPLQVLDQPATNDMIAVGTLEQRKNQQFLIRVLAECHRLGYPYTMTVVGVGPDRAALEQLASSLGLAESVRFTGYVPNAAELMQRHRVLVHGSFAEGFGNVFLEAMAAGRPVFAAAGGAVSEVFEDGAGGYYWDLDDSAGAARLLTNLLENPDLCADMVRMARARAELFSIERQCGALTDFVLGAAITPRPSLPG